MTKAPRIRSLHHIGVAVASLKEAVPRWTDEFGLELDSIAEVPSERVRVAILRAGGARIELLEPMAEDSLIARFLAKKGPGIHHLAFGVEDCAVQIGALKALGAPLLDEEPRPGAHGCRVAFVHPRYLGGALAEFVEDPSDDRA
ncbi:MAG: methylmalonyl-CoA epimerase [Planctomycetota bacterium]